LAPPLPSPLPPFPRPDIFWFVFCEEGRIRAMYMRKQSNVTCVSPAFALVASLCFIRVEVSAHGHLKMPASDG
jgi:hypothetical protein